MLSFIDGNYIQLPFNFLPVQQLIGAEKAEALLGRGALLTGHMKLERPMWDALNLAHQPWHNLWKPDEIRTDSVPELFGLARIRAAALAGQYAFV